MTRLTAGARKHLPSNQFALKKQRKYPINNISHARNALARVANKSPAVRAKVRAAVHRKYPSIGKHK